MLEISQDLVFTSSQIKNSVRIPKWGNWELLSDVLWLYLAERGVNPDNVEDFNECVINMQQHGERDNTVVFYHFSIKGV